MLQINPKKYETYMVTPDKDFAQLVNESVFIYRPVFGGGYETWGVKEVLEKFEISSTSQVIDFLAMKGDSVDNIPGLPGVGDKTAKKFLKEYGSIEGLLENVSKLKGKIKEDELILKKRLDNDVESIVTWWQKKSLKRYYKLHTENRLKPEMLFYADMIGKTWEEAKTKYLGEVGR